MVLGLPTTPHLLTHPRRKSNHWALSIARRARDTAGTRQRFGDPSLATLELCRAIYHSTATNSIHVVHHTAPGETVHLHSLSTSALKKLLVTCYRLSKSSAGPYSPKYTSREGNEKVSGEFLAPAEHPTAGQQTHFGPCCFSNVTWHLHAHVGGDTTMPNACLAEKP